MNNPLRETANILVSIDTRADTHPALEWAVRLAEDTRAKLKIVDVLPEFPWHVHLAMRDEADVRAEILAEKQNRLDQLAGSLASRGLQVATKTLSGPTSVELIREVLRDGHDLIVRVSKQGGSRRPGFLGNTSFRLLRKCPCPVWIVKPDSAPRFQKVMGAVDPGIHDDAHTQLNDEIIQWTGAIAQLESAEFHLLHAWTIYGEQIFQTRMEPEEFEDLQQGSHHAVERAMQRLLEHHDLQVNSERVHLVKGEPANVIPEFTAAQGVDLLVMGTVGRSGLTGMIMGNTAELILDRIQCAVLALKPPGFVSPVKVE